MAIRPTTWDGVYTEGAWLLTRNLVPGVSVYGESLPVEAAVEYRRWDANRSKLAAYLKCGGRRWPFGEQASVLYLGAGSGTTVSHISDICARGLITAVEVSSRSFRNLLTLAERRANLVPVLGDASKPQTYAGRVGTVDVVYQDVAQRDQESIFLKNMGMLRSGGTGFLIVKARSADVTAPPTRVFAAAKEALMSSGFSVMDVRSLAPFQTDHAAVVVTKP